MVNALPMGLDKVSSLEIKTRSVVSFAHYYQPDTGVQFGYDIDWLAITEKNRAVLLVSRYGLYCKPLSSDGNTSWSQSTLRKWLNEEWIEQSFFKYGNGVLVVPTPTDNPLNVRSLLPYKKTVGNGLRAKGENEDYVFLLSAEEANILSEGHLGMEAHWVADKTQLDSWHNVKWWTRPSADKDTNCIDENGEEIFCSPEVSDCVFVRPAMWLDNYYIQRNVMDVTESWRRMLSSAQHNKFDYELFKLTAAQTYTILHLYYNHAKLFVAYPKIIVQMIILIAKYSEIHMSSETTEHQLSMNAANSFCAQSIEWTTIYRRDPANGHLGGFGKAFVMNDLSGQGIVVDADTFDMDHPLDMQKLANDGCFTL